LLHVLLKIKGIFEKKSTIQKCAKKDRFLYIGTVWADFFTV